MEKHEQEIFDKIEATYNTEKGKKFITHLIRAYLPVTKGMKVLDKPEKPMTCAITGVGLISAGEIWVGMQDEEFGKKFVQSLKIAFAPEDSTEPRENPMSEILKGRVLAYTGQKTDTYLCTEAYQQLYNFFATKILTHDKHMNWLAQDMRKKEMVHFMKTKLPGAEHKPAIKRVEQLIAKPKKTTFGDISMLNDLKAKLEAQEQSEKK